MRLYRTKVEVLTNYVEDGNYEAVNHLLSSREYQPISLPITDYNPLLRSAVKDTKILKRLLSTHASFLESWEIVSNLLYESIENNQIEVVTAILSSGAFYSAEHFVSLVIGRALYLALKMSNQPIALTLVEGSFPFIHDMDNVSFFLPFVVSFYDAGLLEVSRQLTRRWLENDHHTPEYKTLIETIMTGTRADILPLWNSRYQADEVIAHALVMFQPLESLDWFIEAGWLDLSRIHYATTLKIQHYQLTATNFRLLNPYLDQGIDQLSVKDLDELVQSMIRYKFSLKAVIHRPEILTIIRRDTLYRYCFHLDDLPCIQSLVINHGFEPQMIYLAQKNCFPYLVSQCSEMTGEIISSAMTKAVEFGHLEIVKQLVEQRSFFTLRAKHAFAQWDQLLLTTIRHGYEDIFHYLLTIRPFKLKWLEEMGHYDRLLGIIQTLITSQNVEMLRSFVMSPLMKKINAIVRDPRLKADPVVMADLVMDEDFVQLTTYEHIQTFLMSNGKRQLWTTGNYPFIQYFINRYKYQVSLSDIDISSIIKTGCLPLLQLVTSHLHYVFTADDLRLALRYHSQPVIDHVFDHTDYTLTSDDLQLVTLPLRDRLAFYPIVHHRISHPIAVIRQAIQDLNSRPVITVFNWSLEDLMSKDQTLLKECAIQLVRHYLAEKIPTTDLQV